MSIHPCAGKPAGPSQLTDISKLITAYYAGYPDPAEPTQRVAFGTSGHRGTSFASSFNETHILAITQAICDYRAKNRIRGPIFLAKDASHFLTDLGSGQMMYWYVEETFLMPSARNSKEAISTPGPL